MGIQIIWPETCKHDNLVWLLLNWFWSLPRSWSIGRSLHALGIISLCAWRTKWLLMNFLMLVMLKVTSGCTMLKYWSRWMLKVWSPGTILWRFTPAWCTTSCLTHARTHTRKHAQTLYITLKQSFEFMRIDQNAQLYKDDLTLLVEWEHWCTVLTTTGTHTHTHGVTPIVPMLVTHTWVPLNCCTCSSKTMWKGKALQKVSKSMLSASG